MNARIVRDLQNHQDFVLLPMEIYQRCRTVIDRALGEQPIDTDDGGMTAEHAISNPVTLMRLKAGLKQKDLAEQLEVSQAYISKIEASSSVSERVLAKVRSAIQMLAVKNSDTRTS